MKQSSFLLFIFSLLMILPVVAVQAGNGHSYEVVSEYQSLVPGRSANVVNWQFDRHNIETGGFWYEVEDRDLKVGCRAEFYFNTAGALEQADCFRWANGKEVGDANKYDPAKPALLTGTIIPGDWLNQRLPFVYDASNREVVIYEQVGTARFATDITIKEHQVSYADALAEGMIRPGLQSALSASTSLYLVEITSRGNHDRPELLLQQLWAVDDNFWLYEAKAERRSWRRLQP